MSGSELKHVGTLLRHSQTVSVTPSAVFSATLERNSTSPFTDVAPQNNQESIRSHMVTHSNFKSQANTQGI